MTETQPVDSAAVLGKNITNGIELELWLLRKELEEMRTMISDLVGATVRIEDRLAFPYPPAPQDASLDLEADSFDLSDQP